MRIWMLLGFLLLTTAAEAQPRSNVISERLWTVSLLRADGMPNFCEAAALGDNPEGGGNYSIRLRRPGNDGLLIVTHDGPPLVQPGEVSLSLDARQIGSFPVDRQFQFSGQSAFRVVLPASFFSSMIGELSKDQTQLMTVRIGKLSFLSAVFGFSQVTAAWSQCAAAAR